MLFRKLIFIYCICCLCACSDEAPEHLSEKYGGVYIDNSQRYGRFYKNPEGAKYSYRHIKATITNDSTIPLYLSFAFSKEGYEPTPANGRTFQVFFLPDHMTPENQANDDFYRTEVMPFLDAGFDASGILQKVIAPKESDIINIGFLAESGARLEPFPITLFSKGHRHHFNSIPDSALARIPQASKGLDLLLALDFFIAGDSIKRYAIIPCGNLSFSRE